MEAILFFVGIVEMFVIAAWTKSVQGGKLMRGGVLSFINISIWYFVLRVVIEDIDRWQMFLVYAFGCSIGTMLNIYVSKRRQR